MSETSNVFRQAREFVLTHARLLERRIFEVRFDAGEPSGVESAVLAYLNPDGGLGHALEPDLRCTTSQPIFAELGLAALEEVGLRSPALAKSLGGNLAGLAGLGGFVPTIQKDALAAPHAGHWQAPEWLVPSPNPSFGLCGLLHYHGFADPWLDELTQTCIRRIQDDVPDEAHSLLSGTSLVAHLPDREVAAKLADIIGRALPEAKWYVIDPKSEAYGVTPLQFAPRPDALFRGQFDDAVIDAHLEALLERQQADGGWPISWQAPGPAAECEWRGRLTLAAISTLCAYGVIRPD